MNPSRALGAVLLAGCVSTSATPTASSLDGGPGVDSSVPHDASTGDVVVDAVADVAAADVADVVDAAAACPFPLDSTLAATIRFSADNERLVYLNGVLVEDNSALGWQSVSSLPVNLHRNPTVANVIAIRGRNTSSQPGADRGIIVELSGDPSDAGAGDGGTAVLLVSDAKWRVSSAAQADLAWTGIAYADASWGAATDQGGNGIAPWGALLGTSTAPRWLWFYDSAATSTKPDLEDAYFRRTFYLSMDGQAVDAPGACP